MISNYTLFDYIETTLIVLISFYTLIIRLFMVNVKKVPFAAWAVGYVIMTGDVLRRGQAFISFPVADCPVCSNVRNYFA